MMPLRPHRADVLAALALAARSRQPLGDGLTRLADGDPLLSRWAAELSPRLADGGDVAGVLRRARLVTRDESRLLAADPDLPSALDRLAAAVSAPPRGLWLVQHLPVSGAIATAIPAAAFCLILVPMGISSRFDSIYRDLGISLPLLTEVFLRPLHMLLLLGCVVAVVTAADALLRRIRGLRHLTHLWCPEVDRQAALLRLIQHARLRDGESERSGLFLRILGRLRLTAERPGHPGWDEDWRTWMFLTRFRLSRAARREAAASPDLATRLIALGAVPLADGRPDWDGAERLCRERLDAALRSALLVIRPALVIPIWMGAFGICLVWFLPLIRIFMAIGQST